MRILRGKAESTQHSACTILDTECLSNIFDSTVHQWVPMLPRGPSLTTTQGRLPYEGKEEDRGFTLGLGSSSPLPGAHCSCFIFRLPLELSPSL